MNKDKQKKQINKVIELNSVLILKKIQSQMQLDTIQIKELKCLKELFKQERKGVISFRLVQIKNAFKFYEGKITSQEIDKNIRPLYLKNPNLTKYFQNIWNEMYTKQKQILIF